MAEKQFANQKTSTSSKQDKQTSSPFSSLIYKIVFVFVLVALLPLFPSSQSIEFGNNSFLKRSWELLHLLVVGIAVSYGLFSSKNSDHDIEKETLPKPDAQQSYISQMLQVSSVFDDDEEDIKSPSKGLDFANDSKNQTWNYSQYYREEPKIMVAEENKVGVNTNSEPLFLPLRGLKAYDHEGNKSSKNCRSGSKENLVLPSPIPWRSRSGKLDVKEESPRESSPKDSKYDNEQGYSRAASFNETRDNIDTDISNPKNLYAQETKGSKIKEARNLSFHETREKTNEEAKYSRSRSTNESLLHELRGKTNEDSGKKKSFQKSYIPPPPPPPPLPHYYSSNFVSEKKHATKSFRDELDGLRKTKRDDAGSNSINLEKNSSNGRSVRTVRPPLHESKKKDEFREKMIIDSESESESENSELSDAEEPTTASTLKEEKQEENEVDKKADEFIAKFREQIRLQRIASIKKSSGQRSSRSSK